MAFLCEVSCQVTVIVMTEREAENSAKSPALGIDVQKKASQKPDLSALEKSLNGIYIDY